MIWFIIGAIVVFVIFKFANDLNKDKSDLSNSSLNEKFKVVINTLNKNAFSGAGKIERQGSKQLSIYEQNQNQIIFLNYSTGSLEVIWKYKFYEKEIVYKKRFQDARNLSLFEQEKIANIVTSEMIEVVKRHKE